MGYFEFLENLPNGSKRKIGEALPNRIVYDGREAIEDTMFGINSWHKGGLTYDGAEPASGYWTPSRIIGLGKHVDDNSDYFKNNNYLTGGSGLKDGVIPSTGSVFAHLPNLEDHCMSSAITGDYIVGNGLWYKEADKIIRTGRTVVIEATFDATTSDAETGADTIKTGQELRELGVFLGGIPNAAITPSSDVTQRPSGMLARSTRYTISGSYINDNPLVMGENPLTVRYTFGDI